MLLEDVANGRVPDVVTDVSQRALNSIESPCRVFLGETYDKVDDHLSNCWPSRFSFVGMVPLLGDQQSMSTQNGVRREESTEFFESFPAKDLTLRSESSPLVVECPTPICLVPKLSHASNSEPALEVIKKVLETVDVPNSCGPLVDAAGGRRPGVVTNAMMDCGRRGLGEQVDDDSDLDAGSPKLAEHIDDAASTSMTVAPNSVWSSELLTPKRKLPEPSDAYT